MIEAGRDGDQVWHRVEIMLSDAELDLLIQGEIPVSVDAQLLTAESLGTLLALRCAMHGETAWNIRRRAENRKLEQQLAERGAA